MAETATEVRPPLTRDRVLAAALALADEGGLGAASMRRVAQRLGVVPMALYKHVANKDELLDGMVDAVVAEIDPPIAGADWKTTMRERILAARRVLLRHRWAAKALETRTEASPMILAYLDSMIGVFRQGGFTTDLMHHAMHAMGSRMLGFSQELFEDSRAVPPEEQEAMYRQLAQAYPNIATMIEDVSHDDTSVIGNCDDQVEFEFALDLLLDGLERLRDRS